MKIGLFEGFGVELEYMIVSKDTLNILPISDKIFKEIKGEFASDFENGEIAWSNELVLHVIELKTNGPAKSLVGLAKKFHDNVKKINKILLKYNAKLMPTAMHPWMNPLNETVIWPYENNEIYNAYNKIFGCQGHGWSNLQSVHINLPFKDDKEFNKLHTAIRLLIPILPAIAASSPILENKYTKIADSRLCAYLNNSKKIPSITGKLVPELIKSKSEYKEKILNVMYNDIAPHDKEGILQNEWLNSRGAIARFDRNTIEIRVLDIQESPLVDLAIVSAIVNTLKFLVYEKFSDIEKQSEISTDELFDIFVNCMNNAESAEIKNKKYLECFNCDGNIISAGGLWKHIISNVFCENSEETREFLHVLKKILNKGSLSNRILKNLQPELNNDKIKEVYNNLCECLDKNKILE